MQALDKIGISYTGGKNSPYIWLKCPGGMDSWRFFTITVVSFRVPPLLFKRESVMVSVVSFPKVSVFSSIVFCPLLVRNRAFGLAIVMVEMVVVRPESVTLNNESTTVTAHLFCVCPVSVRLYWNVCGVNAYPASESSSVTVFTESLRRASAELAVAQGSVE